MRQFLNDDDRTVATRCKHIADIVAEIRCIQFFSRTDARSLTLMIVTRDRPRRRPPLSLYFTIHKTRVPLSHVVSPISTRRGLRQHFCHRRRVRYRVYIKYVHVRACTHIARRVHKLSDSRYEHFRPRFLIRFFFSSSVRGAAKRLTENAVVATTTYLRN